MENTTNTNAPNQPNVTKPNIILITVDQLRFPMHFPAGINSADAVRSRNTCPISTTISGRTVLSFPTTTRPRPIALPHVRPSTQGFMAIRLIRC